MRGYVPLSELQSGDPAKHVRAEITAAETVLGDLELAARVLRNHLDILATRMADRDHGHTLVTPDENTVDARRSLDRITREVRDLRRVLLTWTTLTEIPRFGAF